MVERFGPRDRLEFVAAAAWIGPGTTLQPTGPDHWPGDTGRMRDRCRDVAEQGRRIGIARMRDDLDLAIAHAYRKGSPMGAVRQASSACHEPVLGADRFRRSPGP